MIYTIWVGMSAYEIDANSPHEAMGIYARSLGEDWQFVQILPGDVYQYQSCGGFAIANVKKGRNFHEGD